MNNTALVQALCGRIRAFVPGDATGAAELLRDLEAAIVLDETDFDDAALLSRLLEQFATLVKDGDSAAWDAFRSELPGHTVPVDVEVLFSFLGEAQDHLELMEKRVIALETVSDSKTVNEIFRAVHALKGAAGLLDFGSVRQLCHEMEFVLDELRMGSRRVDRSLIDVLLLACDGLNRLVHEAAAQADKLSVDKGTAHLALEFGRIGGVVTALAEFRASRPATVPGPTVGLEVSDLLRNPELIAKFTQEALETLEVVEQCILTMEKTRTTGDYLNEAFRSIHTLKGNSGFFGFEDLEKLCMDMETHLDALRKGQKSIDDAAVELLLSSLDRLRGLVQSQSAAPPAAAPREQPNRRRRPNRAAISASTRSRRKTSALTPKSSIRCSTSSESSSRPKPWSSTIPISRDWTSRVFRGRRRICRRSPANCRRSPCRSA
jgi:two-component system chemotaxis sensor kinase CheA